MKKDATPAETTPFAVAISEGEREVAEFFGRLTRLVTYGSFLATAPPDEDISVERFIELRTAALYDAFSDAPHPAVAIRLGRGVGYVARLRRLPAFTRIRTALTDAAQTLYSTNSMQDAAVAFEAPLVQEVLSQALMGTGRDKLKAIDEFTGRMSAKKGREGGSRSLRLPPDFVAVMREAIELQRTKYAALPEHARGLTADLVPDGTPVEPGIPGE